MSKTVKVSYVHLGFYAAFVAVATLLVGILPPLVDRPACQNTITKTAASNVKTALPVAKKQSPDLELVHSFGECSNLLNESPNQPWKESRLSKSIRALGYDLELDFQTKDSYKGSIAIKFSVSQPTKFVILHADKGLKLEKEPMKTITIGKDKTIQTECVFSYFANDNIVVTTKEDLKPEDGEFVLKVAFTRSMNQDEAGVFLLEFESESEKKS
jgi:hypothetical protein